MGTCTTPKQRTPTSKCSTPRRSVDRGQCMNITFEDKCTSPIRTQPCEKCSKPGSLNEPCSCVTKYTQDLIPPRHVIIKDIEEVLKADRRHCDNNPAVPKSKCLTKIIQCKLGCSCGTKNTHDSIPLQYITLDDIDETLLNADQRRCGNKPAQPKSKNCCKTAKTAIKCTQDAQECTPPQCLTTEENKEEIFLNADRRRCGNKPAQPKSKNCCETAETEKCTQDLVLPRCMAIEDIEEIFRKAYRRYCGNKPALPKTECFTVVTSTQGMSTSKLQSCKTCLKPDPLPCSSSSKHTQDLAPPRFLTIEDIEEILLKTDRRHCGYKPAQSKCDNSCKTADTANKCTQDLIPPRFLTIEDIEEILLNADRRRCEGKPELPKCENPCKTATKCTQNLIPPRCMTTEDIEEISLKADCRHSRNKSALPKSECLTATESIQCTSTSKLQPCETCPKPQGQDPLNLPCSTSTKNTQAITPSQYMSTEDIEEIFLNADRRRCWKKPAPPKSDNSCKSAKTATKCLQDLIPPACMTTDDVEEILLNADRRRCWKKPALPKSDNSCKSAKTAVKCSQDLIPPRCKTTEDIEEILLNAESRHSRNKLRRCARAPGKESKSLSSHSLKSKGVSPRVSLYEDARESFAGSSDAHSPSGSCASARAQFYHNKLLATIQILQNKEETVRIQAESLSVAEARIAALTARNTELKKELDKKNRQIQMLEETIDKIKCANATIRVCDASITTDAQETDKQDNIVKTLQNNLSVIEELYRECFYETAKQEGIIEMLRKSYLDVRLVEREKSDQIVRLNNVINTQKWSLGRCQDIASEVDNLKIEITNFLNNSNNDSGVWEESADGVMEDLDDINTQLLLLRELLTGDCTCGLEQENKRLEQENRKLKQSIAKLQESDCTCGLEQENKRLVQDNKRLEQENKKLKQSNAYLQESDCTCGLKEENKRLVQDNKRLEQENKKLKQSNAYLQESDCTCGLKEENKRLVQDNKRLEQENKKLKQSNAYLQESDCTCGLKQENKRLVQDNKRLQQENKHLKQSIDNLQGDCTCGLKQENKRLEQENKRLEQENKKLKQNIENLEGDCICGLEQENKRLQQENKSLEQENIKLKQSIDNLQGDCTCGLEQENKRLEQENKKLKQNIENLEGDCTCGLRQENKRLEQEKKKLKQSTANLQKQVNSFLKKIEELENNLSNKETADQHFEEQFRKKEAELCSIRQRLRVLEGETKECCDSCEASTKKLQETEALLTEKCAEICQLQNKCRHYEEALIVVRNECQKYEQCNSEICSLREENKQLTKATRSLKSRLVDAQRHAASLEECCRQESIRAQELESELSEAASRGAALCGAAKRCVRTVKAWATLLRDKHQQQTEILQQKENQLRCLRHLLEQRRCDTNCPNPPNVKQSASETEPTSSFNRKRFDDGKAQSASEMPCCSKRVTSDSFRCGEERQDCAECPSVSEIECTSLPTAQPLWKKILCKKSVCEAHIQRPVRSDVATCCCEEPPPRACDAPRRGSCNVPRRSARDIPQLGPCDVPRRSARDVRRNPFDGGKRRSCDREVRYCTVQHSTSWSPCEEVFSRVEGAGAALAAAVRRWRHHHHHDSSG